MNTKERRAMLEQILNRTKNPLLPLHLQNGLA